MAYHWDGMGQHCIGVAYHWEDMRHWDDMGQHGIGTAWGGMELRWHGTLAADLDGIPLWQHGVDLDGMPLWRTWM